VTEVCAGLWSCTLPGSSDLVQSILPLDISQQQNQCFARWDHRQGPPTAEEAPVQRAWATTAGELTQPETEASCALERRLGPQLKCQHPWEPWCRTTGRHVQTEALAFGWLGTNSL
jgi:hypothetical protein